MEPENSMTSEPTFTKALNMRILFLFSILFLGSPEAKAQCLKVLSTESPRAVVLVVHGLNTNPEKMLPLANELRRDGIEALNLELAGHRSDSRINEVTSSIWATEMKLALEQAQARAQDLNVPLYFLGYSLGGLVGLEVLQGLPANVVQKMVLLAPAIRLKWKTNWIRVFSPFPTFIIPSLAPADYRANWGTSMAAYKSLFQTVKRFNSQSSENLNIPTLVFSDRKDELVSFSGLQEVERSLSQWKVIEVSNHDAPNKSYHHLILDSNTLGTVQWRAMLQQILTHFGR